jgi:hypothetical protein
MCHPRLLSLSALLVLTSGIRSEPPQWWTEGANPVLDSGAVPNNRGPANIGQAKHMAKSALDALATVLPSTAAAVEQDLTVPQSNPAGGTFPVILDFTVPDPKTPEWIELQKAPLLTGQLKAIAHPFYFHLDAAASVWLADQRAANGTESGGIFPWTDDHSDDNHHGMANLGQLKAVFSLHFTRDMDGDGLLDIIESIFGTNPAQAMTFPGIPDAWVAANFPSGLGFDPDDDPARDGITNSLKYQLGLDPHTYYITGLVNPGFNEEITDEPTLSFREEYPSDLYEQDSVEGWQADIGGHIEIWDEDDGNPYVELQSDMQAHGVKQEFEMLPGSRLNYILRYKGRYEYEAYDNAFKLEVAGAEEMLVNGNSAPDTGGTKSHVFMNDDAWDPGMENGVWQENQKYGEWHYASVSITAPPGTSGLKQLTLSLVPQTTTSGTEDITYGGFVDIIPVAVEDNEFATGVDAVSIKADPQDRGYQDKFWIMAPSGNDPNGNPCSNGMKFRIPADASIELEIAYPQGAQAPATPTPGTVTLGAEGADCAWHGESPITTEDPAVVWKIGAPGQIKTAVDLPIAVKTMKRRTVRVALHQIESVVPGKPNNPPDLMPTKAQVEDKLNRVFGHQINAWFDVTPLPAEPVAFDIAHANIDEFRNFEPGSEPVPGDGVLAFTAWTGPEVSLATSNRPDDYDIHVYVIGGASPFQTYFSASPELWAPGDKQIGRANTLPGENYCIIDGDRTSNFILEDWDRSLEGVIHTIAHEVGHILVGAGHPDEGGGDAPLLGTDRTLRLMCSGSKWTENSLLIVKREWDKAEVWLSTRPNGDN